MEENAKKRFAIILVASLGLVYFFVCAKPLPKELVLEPAWAKPIPQAQAVPATAASGAAVSGAAAPVSSVPLHSYRLADSFGYFSEKGDLISANALSFGAAVSDSAYIAYDRDPPFLSLRSPDGRESAKITDPGYPFFGGGRLFVVHPGQSSVSEIGKDGRTLWSHDFGSIVTAFDASPALALFGLLDGSLVGIAPDGVERLSFAPGGSRIPGIYGCAVSPDGLMVAAIAGLDQQRLVILERRSTAYRVTYHRYLKSDFRRPVSMAFTRDGRYLVYEEEVALGIYNRGSRSETSVPAQALTGIGLFSPSQSILLGVEGSEDSKRLVCISPAGKLLYSLPFSGSDASIDLSGEAIFLCVGGPDGHKNLLRLDFKEE
jgi:hypothetical protein